MFEGRIGQIQPLNKLAVLLGTTYLGNVTAL